MTKAQKLQIITPLVTMGIIALLLIVFHGRGEHRAFVLSQTYQIGQNVVSPDYPRRLVFGPELERRLSGFLVSTGRVEAVRFGDEPAPIGDGKASSRLYLINGNHERLALRLTLETKGGGFHVLGIWTPSAPPK
jgi:hypothetical protein